MESLKIYEINANYIDYLLPFAPHLFHNSKKGQANSRKYIGILLQVHGFDYFAPLSSFKPKHEKMKEGLDFIKIKHYSVINLNNMFPAPKQNVPTLISVKSEIIPIAPYYYQNIVSSNPSHTKFVNMLKHSTLTGFPRETQLL